MCVCVWDGAVLWKVVVIRYGVVIEDCEVVVGVREAACGG